MKLEKRLPLLLLLLISIFSCTEIIDPNISSESTVLLSPPPDHHSNLSTQQFWWDYMEFADNYQLQVVSPSFEYIERLIIDTLLNENKYTVNLTPAQYQWRVRGLNYSYCSNYSTRTLTIDSTGDITQEVIILVEPSIRDTSNSTQYFFRWQSLYNADDYNFLVLFEGAPVYSVNTISDTTSYNLSEGDGTYTWKVRGQNESSNTQYSQRTIYLDTKSPSTPQQEYPENYSVLPDSILTFTWLKDQSGGSSIKDSLVIARDIFMTLKVVEVLTSSSSYSDSLGQGIYYWRIRSIDAAGNESEYSPSWKFSIQ